MRLSWKLKSVDMPASEGGVSDAMESGQWELTLEEKCGLDGRTPQVGALEQVGKLRVSAFESLDFDGTLHHGKGVVCLGL